MFPKARSAIIEICKTWRKSEISKGVSTYYSHFEENLAKNIQNDLEEYKKAIDALNNRENELKKEIKKDKEKKRTLEEVREKLMRNKAELEKKKKELQNLPQHVKDIKESFDKKFKDLSRYIDDVIRSSDGKDVQADFKRFSELLERFAEVNDLVRLNEIIKNSGVEFKIDMDGGQKRVKEFRKIMVLIEESMACLMLDEAFSEPLVSKRIELFNRANDVIGEAATLSKTERFDVNYYAAWQSFVKGCLVIDLGVKAMESYDYTRATKYFLKAREMLSNIKDLPLNDVITEKAMLARAYASDAFNLIYLLNSYASWKSLAKSTKDDELKEIAKTSEKNIEEWITKQYGFPPEAKISALLNEMIWPVPEMPSEANITKSSTSKQVMDKYKN